MSLQGKVQLLNSWAAFIESVAAETTNDNFPTLGAPELQSKLDLLETTWARFDTANEKLLKAPDPALFDDDYIKTKLYERIMSAYSQARALLIQGITTKGENPDLSATFRRDSTTPPADNSTLPTTHPTVRPKLPLVTLPQFSGEFTQWVSFRDLFNSLVGSNGDISNVMKMHYLKTSVTGDAALLISHLPITEDAFTIAWKLVCSRFDNPRLLISTQINRLLDSSPMAGHTGTQLNQLLYTTAEALNSLRALDVPMDSCDPFIVAILCKKLSPLLIEAWEYEIGESTKSPTLTELINFLQGRARAMESIEARSVGATSSPPVDKTNRSRPVQQSSRTSNARTYATTLSPKVGSALNPNYSEPNPCSFCSSDHFIAYCRNFQALSATDRRHFILQQSLCYNCMGKHSVRDCRSLRRCQICRDKHHSLIHTDVDTPATVHVAQSAPTIQHPVVSIPTFASSNTVQLSQPNHE